MNVSFCSECGERFADPTTWPRACIHCDTIRWRNPVPVAAVIQPVLMPDGEIGIVIAKRAIQPMLGHWSLIGGFMEVGETVPVAAAREFREETSLEVAMTPRIVFTDTVGADGSQLMLMTCIDKPLSFEVFQQGRPCPENEELGLLTRTSDIVLAFPTHREAVARYFAGEFNDHA